MQKLRDTLALWLKKVAALWPPARDAAMRWVKSAKADLEIARRGGLRTGALPLLRARRIEAAVAGALLLLLIVTAARPKHAAVAPPIPMMVPVKASVAPPAPAPPVAVKHAAIAVERPSDPDSLSLRSLATELHAPGSPLENPCVVTSAGTCLRTAMDPFFEALDAAKTKGSPTVVLALGNSLIAGDGVVDVLRTRLTAAYGDAGRGYLLADRMASYGGRSRCAARASGWRASTFAPPYHYRWPFGLAGVHHTAEQAGATSTFTLHGETKAELFWLDRPEASTVDVLVDGTHALTLEPTHEERGRRNALTVPSDARELTLVAKHKGVVIQGVTLEKEQSGIVLDMLGVPSADASIFLQANEAIFDDQLKARRASLVMLMFGGNETKRIAWGRSSEEKVIRDLRTLIARVKKSTDAACWVVGPLDAVVKRPAGPYTQRPELEEVIAMERQVALEEGCGWLDLFLAMGGSGSVKRFDQHGLMHDDHVHPKGRGLDVLGQLITDALFDAYATARNAPPRAEATR